MSNDWIIPLASIVVSGFLAVVGFLVKWMLSGFKHKFNVIDTKLDNIQKKVNDIDKDVAIIKNEVSSTQADVEYLYSNVKRAK